ncbi:MAG: DUF1553 domain-containing protein [Bryobacteraceae bacterium]
MSVPIIRTATACLALFSLAASTQAADNKPLDYGREVRPILAEKCFHCHGQDSKKRMAGLRLDTYEGATELRNARAALVPGNPEHSTLFQRITADKPALRMPPAWSNRTLSAEEIAILKRWIEEGGRYTRHWAFVPPERPTVPDVADSRWVKQPIDAFVWKRLQEEGLQPNRDAPPETWLRRVSLDLIGLPPAPADYDAFLKDVKARGEAAYSSAVDRLLASPRYGERMAIDWLDAARYADTHGFNNDSERSMWRWRDWVIDSFNANMPYDRFLTEQLAGDLLPNPSLDQRIATGFLRNHVINSEGGIIEEEYRVEYVADRVRTLGMTWLGLTLECARCHDHKYDPISQRDYYRFFAFFNNVAEHGEDGRVTNAVPFIAAPTKDQRKRLAELESRIQQLIAATERIEKSWRWRDAHYSAAVEFVDRATVPDDAALRLACDPEGSFPATSDKPCAFRDSESRPETAPVPVSKRRPMTFSLWVKPSKSDTDVALLSTVDYAKSEASVEYGRGIELRLVGGELEFRYADRFPAYSIRVRSEGAAIGAGQWRHLTLVYEGAGDKETGRADASWVRMFIDGREAPTRILSEGVSMPAAKNDKPSPTKFRIGWDNALESRGFAGRLDAIAFWTRALADDEIRSLFEKIALPYAAGKHREGNATGIEAGWLRSALLRQANAKYASRQRELETTRAEWLALRRNAPTVMVMEEMETPRETRLLLRGAYDAPGEVVGTGVPESLLGPWPEGAPANRLGLARWLTKPDHPLTSRVVVNHFWQQLFGAGLVKSSDNFGLQGEWPSHPELLDWLTREFVDSGWNVKALLKQIVLSATYRQDSGAPPALFARDPENRLLARGPRFRLPAEVIRDQALFLSGLLKNRLGGPSVYPYQPAGLYDGIVVAANYPGSTYVESQGDDLYRRSLYTFWKRTVPHPTMIVFDAPDREFCTVRRSTTNTPLQALTLLNDPSFVEASRKFAERAFREGGGTAASRLAFLFRTATGRDPNERERRVLQETFDRLLAEFRSDEAGARAWLSVGAAPVDASLPAAELAACAAVANMILNMDEVVTKG